MRASALLSFVLVFAAACAELKSASPPGPDADVPTTSVETTHPRADDDDDDDVVTNEPSKPVERRDAGADASVDADAAVDPQAGTICNAYCAVNARCEGVGSAAWLSDCLVSCQKLWTGRAPHLRADYVTRVEDCYETLSCNESKGTCLSPWNALETSGVPVVSACLSKKGTCGLLQGTDCNESLAYDDPTRAALEACFSKPCVSVTACIETARGD